MQIARDPVDRNCPEADIYNALLPLDNAQILELGCGSAALTREIAEAGEGRQMVALEVDEIAHAKNLEIDDLPNVRFALAGAEAIPLADAGTDIVLMFKSLHHVPLALMDQAMREIHRVLKPGGLAYISEPVFAGDFNEILRLFHDEQQVREAAFATLQRAVASGLFELVDEVFFNAPMHFADFSEFENNTIRATHSQHKLDAALYRRVKQAFEQHMSEEGANFLMPMRVDLLRKPNTAPQETP